MEDQYFNVINAFDNNIFEDKNANWYSTINDDYIKSYNEIEKEYKKTDKEKFDSELAKLEESDYQKKLVVFNSLLATRIDSLFIDDLNKTKQLLIVKFGEVSDRISMPIYGAKKKYDYTQINICQVNAQDIINRKDKSKKKWCTYQELSDTLTRCISVWEEESKLVDFENNDARINTDIYTGLQFNIMNAYILIGDLDKAKKAYNEANKHIEQKFMAAKGSYLWHSREMERHFALLESKAIDKITFFNQEQL